MNWSACHLEVQKYLALVQQDYAEAFSAGDEEGMAEISFELSWAYASLGQSVLAAKWNDESLRMLTVAGC